jgi:hypothetical protein
VIKIQMALKIRIKQDLIKRAAFIKNGPCRISTVSFYIKTRIQPVSKMLYIYFIQAMNNAQRKSCNSTTCKEIKSLAKVQFINMSFVKTL